MATINDSARITSMAKKRKTKVKNERGNLNNFKELISLIILFKLLLQTMKLILNFHKIQKNLLKKSIMHI
jgi:hypothetical protein